MRAILMYIILLASVIPAMIVKVTGTHAFGNHTWQELMFIDTWTGRCIWIGILFFILYPIVARKYHAITTGAYIRKISNT